jgi:hypothetical protein
MKREVRVFIEGQQIDLFNDETIEVNSSVQNIADISKTSTDFSQAFTIPATTRNNAIFQHFYQSDVDGTYNFQERKDGYIEIDMTTFRRGRVQLEKSNVKNGQVENYTITFYGELTSLKDLFGEDKLSDLDYLSVDQALNLTTLQLFIEGTLAFTDIAYPLISSGEFWQYNTQAANGTTPSWFDMGTAAEIDTLLGAIDTSELFPALRLSRIIQLIELRYGITFSSNFFATDNFTKAYLWYKNRDRFELMSTPQTLGFGTFLGQSVAPPAFPNNVPMVSFVDTINETILIQATSNASNGGGHSVYLELISPPTLIPYFVDVYSNGNLVQSIQGDGTGALFRIVHIPDTLGLNNLYYFQIRAQGTINLDFNIYYFYEYTFGSPIVPVAKWQSSSIVNIPTTSLQRNAPDLKISDFFSGLLKEFNLTVTGTDTPNTFLVETLNYWYASGNVFDITNFTDSTSIDVERVKLYKKISFRYQPSESITNKFYLQTGLKEYGNTEQSYPYDGGELNIDVPFENLMFSKYTGTNIQVGFSINSALAPYIPKPCILYYSQDVVATNPIYLKDASASFAVCNSVQIFGQDTNVGGIDYSLNFAPETSTYLGIPIQQSLFATYYFDYLANLFDPKNRLTKVKAVLPISILTSLKLNDRLIIRDKRYIINDFKTKLTTGETTLTLLNDFIPIQPESNYRETEDGNLRNVEGFFLTNFRIIEN